MRKLTAKQKRVQKQDRTGYVLLAVTVTLAVLAITKMAMGV